MIALSLLFFVEKKVTRPNGFSRGGQKKPVPDFKIGAGSEGLHPLPRGFSIWLLCYCGEGQWGRDVLTGW